MSKLMNYRVVRRHEGDRVYEEGETRIAVAADVQHLVPNVLQLIGPAEPEAAPAETAGKAEPPHPNKAEGAAPANKATTRRGAKGKTPAAR